MIWYICFALYGANTVVELNFLLKLFQLFLEGQILTVELARATPVQAM
jgi:hypothetical protein